MLKTLVEIFILPPFNLFVLAAIGLVLLRRHRRAGIIVISIALALLFAFSTPIVGYLLSQSTRSHEALIDPANLNSDAQAIVILGAGKYLNAPEYGGDTIRASALERVRYGAHLHRKTGKPIMVSGGDPTGTGSSEAELMRAVLESEFGVAVTWSEDSSDNTFESAANSREILHKNGIDKIFLVTHVSHMTRASRSFEQAGFKVAPAPTMFPGDQTIEIRDFIPHPNAMIGSTEVVKEWIGRAWYIIRE